MKHAIKILSLISCLLGFYACPNPKKINKKTPQKKVINNALRLPYDLTEVMTKHTLPKKLTEISGLSYWNKKQLLALQDERADVFVFNTQKSDVDRRVTFGKHGDFEGIEVVDSTIWAVNSSGVLYEIKNFDTDEQFATQYKTFLRKTNDVEGLCYDRANHSLLLACKGRAGRSRVDSLRTKKAIYTFDLNHKKLLEQPAYLIDRNELATYLNTSQTVTFNPSGIAIHPLTHHIYIIATSGKLLIVIEENGKVLNVAKLDSHIFKQPEGIAFTPTGDLFISNEGRKGKANILHFIYQN